MSGLVQVSRRRRRRIMVSGVVVISSRPIGLTWFTLTPRTGCFVRPITRRGDCAVNTSVADDNLDSRTSSKMVPEWDGYWAAIRSLGVDSIEVSRCRLDRTSSDATTLNESGPVARCWTWE